MTGEEKKHKFLGNQASQKFTLILFLITSLSLLVVGFGHPKYPYRESRPAASPASTPTADPLAIPVLPENPTEFDLGKHSYYYNCMPCHGGHGEGLTDEWRQTWEEDHRNCWDRGCHGGRLEDEGFPIPTIVPAIILDNDALQKYAQPEVLVTYLRTTHPPQSPGILADDDYQSLVAYLWAANGKDTNQAAEVQELSPDAVQWKRAAALALVGISVIVLIGLGIFANRQKTKKNERLQG